MNRSLWHWWPLAPALLVLYLGMNSFMEKYPQQEQRSLKSNSPLFAPDSMLILIRQAKTMDSLNQNQALKSKDSVLDIRSPFRPVRNPSQVANRGAVGPKIDPPWRNYVLKGTVGNSVATIMDRNGKKIIVKVGEIVDSATVMAIESNRVILKDRAGKFELLQE
jgi:hypothetical protein